MLRNAFKIGKSAFKAAEHAHFADILFSTIFDWKTGAIGVTSAVLSFFSIPAIRDWSPLTIVLVSIAIGAGVSIIYIAVRLLIEDRPKAMGPQAAHTGLEVPEATTEQMPIVQFLRLAGERGWQVRGEHDLEAIDLLNGLTQAGANGTVHFQGRGSAKARLGPPPLVPIDQTHWYEFEFDWHSIIGTTDNINSCTRQFSQKENRFIIGYTDIHLDGAAAIRWLDSNEALAFKGQTARGERERKRLRCKTT